MQVQFEGEEGIDSGGLAKEFFVLCAEALVSSSSSSSSSWSPSNTAAGGVAGSSVKRPTTVPNSSGTAYFQVDRRSSNRSSSGTAGDASYTVCVARHDGGASTARGHSRGCARRESGGAIRGGKGRGKGKGSSSGSTSNAAAVAAPPPSASASSAPPSGAWRAVGRFLGKALVDRQLVPPLRFNHALLKRFLGRPVSALVLSVMSSLRQIFVCVCVCVGCCQEGGRRVARCTSAPFLLFDFSANHGETYIHKGC